MLRQALDYLRRTLRSQKEQYSTKVQKKRIRLDIEALEMRWLPASYSFASATYSVDENIGKLTVTVNLGVPAPSDATVGINVDSSYSTSHLATTDVDFSHYQGTLFFTTGASSQTFDVFITDDDLSEYTESFRIKLENPTGTYGGSAITIGATDKSVVSINNVTPSTWILTAQPTRLSDPMQGFWQTFGKVQYSPNDGNFRTAIPLTFGHDGDSGNDAWSRVTPNPALVYYPQGADGRPLGEAVLSSASDVPYSITWNGSTQTSPGSQDGRIYTIPLTDTGTTADAVGWTSTLVATFTTRGDIVRTVTQTAIVPGSGTWIAPGWGIAGVDRLVSTSSGMLWVYGQGGAQLFSGAGPSYTSPSNNFGTLVQNIGGDFTYTSKNQVIWNFNSSGQLTAITDSHSLSRTFTYSSGLLSTVNDPDGRTTTFVYSSGKLVSVVQPGNRTVTLTINGTSGDLTSLVMPDGRSVTYSYDSYHRLTSESLGAGTYSYSYDATTRLLTGINANNYQGSSVSLSSTLGQVSAGSSTEATLKAVITDALSHKTTFTLDRAGRILTQANSWGGNNEAYQYNDAGQVTSYTDPLGQRTTYTYDGSHDLTQTRRPDNSVVTFQYDSTYHRITKSQDSLLQVTTFTYNGAGDLVSITDPLNRVTTMSWASNGLLSSMTDPLGRTTQLQYSNRQVTVVIDALGNRTTYSYDSAGNRTSIQDARGNTTQFTFDGMRRLLTLTDALSGVVTYTYGTSGYLATVEDHNQRHFDYGFDTFFGIIDYQAVTTTNTYQTLGSSSTTYNSMGWLTAATDGLGHTVTYTYNTAGWPITKTDALNQVTSFTYDASGQLKTIVDPRGNVTTYSYDSRGHLSSITNPQTGITQ